ncbi:SUZ RNA-binding domain-containing-like isoform X2 [Dysidea avara]|uniref:SUZ RNA-binding domain-containing-like isoform X2 n=1 Tax=Dysidea avara TaxID=196820 RepID=UPI00331F2FF4
MAEDVDDNIIDSWEDADAEELERRMEERKAVLVPKQAAVTTNEAAVGTDDVVPPVEFGKMDNRLPLKIQDSERTEYVSPIKILKRPEKQTAEESQKNKEMVKVHKSLAEREADYASARYHCSHLRMRESCIIWTRVSQRIP